MKKIVGVRFKPAGKVYDFDCGAFVLNLGDHVIVETEKGLGFGMVAVLPQVLETNQDSKQYKKVFRVASDADFAQVEKNGELEKKAHCLLPCLHQGPGPENESLHRGKHL